jgi:DNA-binding protein HU-beta
MLDPLYLKDLQMNKGALISAFSTATESKPKEAQTTIETLMGILKTALAAGEEVTLPGIGKLKVAVRPGRTGRNPKTGEALAIAAKRVVKFSPASEFNDSFKVIPEVAEAV